MDKKAQHEMVGFVLIVVIVTIIGMVFLALMIGNKKDNHTSIEISNLLQATMYYTTDCSSDYNPRYRDIEDLIKDCQTKDSKRCKDGRKACDALKTAIASSLDSSLKAGETSPYRAYYLRAYYRTISDPTPLNDVVILQKGVYKNCSSEEGSSHMVLLGSGSFSGGYVNVELTVCRNKGYSAKNSGTESESSLDNSEEADIESQLKDFFKNANLKRITIDGEEAVLIQKSNVIINGGKSSGPVAVTINGDLYIEERSGSNDYVPIPGEPMITSIDNGVLNIEIG